MESPHLLSQQTRRLDSEVPEKTEADVDRTGRRNNGNVLPTDLTA